MVMDSPVMSTCKHNVKCTAIINLTHRSPVSFGVWLKKCWGFWEGSLREEVIYSQGATIKQTQSTEVSHWSVLTASFRIHTGIWVPLQLYFPVADSFSLFAAKSQVTQYIQTLRWPMSTHAPWLESFCFPGYHLGFRKHSFMVAGLLPAGPMVINQGRKWNPPLRLLQTLCWEGSRWASFKWLFPIGTEHRNIIFL